ncbi:hypothetical protein OUZ56_020443 [Daphnia magna]|uniref:Uncharacterized protein n=1 Tax=Daphnia magna TaxID=35525 RepID=A0ABQ9ZEH5_9CRUS|nr:hypothetical protein OUZ56_020443 [Daphnia magna]
MASSLTTTAFTVAIPQYGVPAVPSRQQQSVFLVASYNNQHKLTISPLSTPHVIARIAKTTEMPHE